MRETFRAAAKFLRPSEKFLSRVKNSPEIRERRKRGVPSSPAGRKTFLAARKVVPPAGELSGTPGAQGS
jgi:hypothetical protein